MTPRQVLSSAIATVVDAMGGVPVHLPDNSRARVGFHSRHLISAGERRFANLFSAALSRLRE